MKVHSLKTDPKMFRASFAGLKNWEIRFNDRDFKAGDMLILQETVFPGEEMQNGAPLEYTGLEMARIVDFILEGPAYGLAPRWVIMSVPFRQGKPASKDNDILGKKP